MKGLRGHPGLQGMPGPSVSDGIPSTFTPNYEKLQVLIFT